MVLEVLEVVLKVLGVFLEVTLCRRCIDGQRDRETERQRDKHTKQFKLYRTPPGTPPGPSGSPPGPPGPPPGPPDTYKKVTRKLQKTIKIHQNLQKSKNP